MIGVSFRINKAMFFFDQAGRARSAVIRRMDIATRRVLSKFGAFVRTRARGSMRRRNSYSQPGEPPHAHIGHLKHFLEFGYDPNRRSVVIGPEGWPDRETDKTVPELMEYGGTVHTRRMRLVRTKEARRDSRGRFKAFKYRQIPSGTTVHYEPRPFMWPAYEHEEPKLEQMWRNAVIP